MTYDFNRIIDRRSTNSLKCAYPESFGKSGDELPMWVADMDFSAPPCVCDALRRAVDHGIYGYPCVGDGYLSAVTGWFSSRFNMDVSPSDVVPIPGVVHALATAVRAYTEPGDGVLVCTPVYNPFFDAVISNGRRLIISRLISDGGTYGIDFDDFEKKAAYARLFLLCSPHNPVGRVWTKAELLRIGEICLRNNVTIVCDMIHADFVYPGHKHIPISTLSPELADITVTATAPSKTFNIAGLCASNVFIKNARLREQYQATLLRTHSGSINCMGLIACEAAYRGGGDWLSALLVYLRENADTVEREFSDKLPEIKLSPLEGTYLLWADFRGFGLTSRELNEKLDRDAKVWFSAGSVYGEEAEGFYRINIGCPASTVNEMCRRLASAFCR